MKQSIRFKLCKKILWSLLLGIIFASCRKDYSLTFGGKGDLLIKEATEQCITDATVLSHLIGFWKFNGNPNDASGKGNHGKL